MGRLFCYFPVYKKPRQIYIRIEVLRLLTHEVNIGENMIDFDKLSCFIDLHLHLDGSLSLKNIRELSEVSGIPCPESDAELKKLVSVDENCKSLNDYLEKFDFPLSFLQDRETITLAVKNLLKEIHEDGVMYAEVRFAPQLHLRHGLTQKEVVEAALTGLKESGVPGGLILCLMRGNGNESQNGETILAAKEFLKEGVAAVDLAGAEALFPTQNYTDEFALAKGLGIPVTIHAGEADGFESVLEALSFGAARIGHGYHAMDDEDTMTLLREKNVTLEMCPKSNLDTHTCSSLSDYPVKLFMDKGIPVTINTDDMTVSDTTLKEEFKRISSALSLDEGDIKKIFIASAKAAFTDDAVKRSLIKRIEDEFNGGL